LIASLIVLAKATAHGQPSVDLAGASSTVLLHSLQSAHAVLSREDVSDWSTVNHKWTDSNDLLQLATRTSNRLGIIHPNYSVRTTSHENSVSVNGETLPDHARVNVVVTSINETTVTPLTVMSADLTDTSGQDHLSTSMNLLQRALSAEKIQPNLRACVRGAIPVKWEGAKAQASIRHIFKQNGIQSIEGFTSQLETSISGYTSSIPQSILSKQKPMNVQMAVHYNETMKQTVLTIGTPIITIEY